MFLCTWCQPEPEPEREQRQRRQHHGQRHATLVL
jgi:hypothetical protein